MDVNQKLNQLLNDRGWSEYKLSKKCGLSHATLGNVFRRNNIPTIATLETICKAFGITLSQFFAENEMVEMTPELKKLFDGWCSLTVKQKQVLTDLVETFNNER